MAQEDKIEDRVSVAQCKRAIDVLHDHVSKFMAKKAETQLLPATEPWFWLTIALKGQPEGKALKVFRIPVSHPIVDPRKESICLLTKDPQRTYKDLIADNDIKFIHRVIGIQKLRGKHKAFEARRALLKEHGLFLADDRILPLLPKLLGSKFFEAKKQPIPVTLTRKNLKQELEHAINSTYMPSILGTAVSIKIGRFSQKPAQVLANIKTALPAIAAKVNGGWDNIQSIGIKTSDSANLPLWSCSLDDEEGGRWTGLTAEDEDTDSDDADVDEDVDMDGDDEKSDSSPVIQPKQGKKRVADLDEGSEEVEKPKKKSKSSESASVAAKGTPASKKTTSTPAQKSLSSDDTISALPQSLSKPKAKKASAPGAPTPVNTPATTKRAVAIVPIVTPSEKPSTKKKVTVEPVTPAAVDAAPKKKKEKRAASAPEGIIEPTPPVVVSASTPVAESTSLKKSKKTRTSETATASAPSAAPEAIPDSTSKKVAAVVADSASTSAVAEQASISEAPKKKKKKHPVVPDEVGDILSAAAAIASTQSKTEKKSATTATEVEVFVPAVEETVEVSKKKRERKPKKSNKLVVEEEDVAVAVVETEAKKEKKKGRKSAGAEADPEGDAMVVDAIPAVAPSSEPPAKKKKGKKEQAEKVEEGSALSKEDLKQKRSDAPGEKKKNKVVKAKGGKSAKDALLGKKVI